MIPKDYPRLLRRLPEMLAPGGRILLSLNSPAWSWENIEGVEILQRIEPPEDFAPSEEGRGLKIIVAGMV